MKRLMAASVMMLASASVALPSVVFGQHEEVQVEKKTTQTYPSGRIVVENESSRTFKLQGQTQVYTAPADVDLNTYTGQDVTVYTDSGGKVTRLEKKTTVVK